MLENMVEYKRFVWELNNTIEQESKSNNIVFLCLGTNQIIGDSFGPLVGSILKKRLSNNKNVKIIGDLDNVITYNEIHECRNYLSKYCRDSLVVVLDSALSNQNNIGKVYIQNRGLRYAESLKKENDVIGNVSIKAVVGENKFNNITNFKNLQQASLQNIHNMSNIVSNGIIEVLNKKANNGKNICN